MAVCTLVLEPAISLELELGMMTQSKFIHQTYLIQNGREYSFRAQATTAN